MVVHEGQSKCDHRKVVLHTRMSMSKATEATGGAGGICLYGNIADRADQLGTILALHSRIVIRMVVHESMALVCI